MEHTPNHCEVMRKEKRNRKAGLLVSSGNLLWQYKMVHEIISISASYIQWAINNFKCEAGILYYRGCSRIEAKS